MILKNDKSMEGCLSKVMAIICINMMTWQSIEYML